MMLVSPVATGQTQRAWTPRDSIGVRYYGWNVFGATAEESIHFSPDGARFFVVYRSGDLAADENIYTVDVYAVADVRAVLLSASEKVPAPMASVTMRARSDVPAIIAPRWLSSDDIVFMNAERTSIDQLLVLDAATGALRPLLPERRSLHAYEVHGDRVVYLSSASLPEEPDKDLYPYHAVTQDEFFDAFIPGRSKRFRFELRVVREGVDRRVMTIRPPVLGDLIWISPDGRHAAAYLTLDHDTPVAWRRYDGVVHDIAANQVMRPNHPQFVLVDLQTLQAKALFDAPGGGATLAGRAVAGWPDFRFPRALWTPDSRHLILFNTATPRSPQTRPDMAYVVAYDVDSGRWQAIEPVRTQDSTVTDVRLEGGTLRLAHGSPSGSAADTFYALRGGRWASTKPAAGPASAAGPARPVEVLIRESMNEPPALVARLDGREAVLSSPDPALAGVHRAAAEAVEWTEPDGKRATGVLMTPAGPVGTPPPLVIQAYNSMPGLFRPDGPYQTAYAAQALVARGFAVLGVDIPTVDRPELSNTPRETAAFVTRVDAAVEALAGRKLIDPKRVGLVGFSRGGYMVSHAISHAGRTRIAAAVDGDGWIGDYLPYVINGSLNGPQRDFELMNGNGASFWDAPEAWLRNSPGFRVRSVQTPLLMTSNQTGQTAWYAERMAAFRKFRRPLEILNFPRGQHPLGRPRERFESMTATVDWMAFWILGEENPDPAYGERNARWRQLREEWQTQRKSEVLPPADQHVHAYPEAAEPT